MSALTFKELAGVIEQHGTCLDHAVYTAGCDGRTRLRRSIAPDGMFAAVIEAGAQLNGDPEVILSRRPLPDGLLGSIPQEDVAARSLVQIIQNSMHHDTGNAWDTTFDCPTAGTYYGTCDEAEPSFAATINHMATGENHYDPYTHSHEIVTGEGERPVLLRKASGEQSALSLLPLTIRGVTYPAGSIVQYNLGRDYDSYGSDAYDKYPLIKDEGRIATVDDIEQINFLRLSAFAIASGYQRQSTFGAAIYRGSLRNAAEASILWDFDVEQIADIASAAMGKLAQPL